MQCTASSVCWNGLKIGLFSVFYIKVNKESKLIWSNLIAEASKELPLCIQQIFDGSSHQMIHQPIIYGYSHLGYSESLIYKLVAELYVKRILPLVVWYQPKDNKVRKVVISIFEEVLMTRSLLCIAGHFRVFQTST